MATTPNTATEQATKLTVRANNFTSGANSYTSNPTQTINALATSSGFWNLTVSDFTTAFVISGTAGTTAGTTLNGNSTVSQLQAALAAGPLKGLVFTIPTPGEANLLGNTTTAIILASGTTLVASGSTAAITNVAITSGAEGTSYPQYAQSPNATPTWIDDAVVHAYPVNGVGSVVQDTTKVVEVQVRQINTSNGPDGGLETQQWNGYFAAYQGNLNQTHQKNTKQQQC